MNLLKVASGMALSSVMLLALSSSAFAQPLSQETNEKSDVSVTLDGETTRFTSSEITKLAELNRLQARYSFWYTVNYKQRHLVA
ncbi:MAG: hypothetical protein LBJ26_06965 [Paenibacillus sp.]|nr:hypothetical protein [Paenibacillus sp.]